MSWEVTPRGDFLSAVACGADQDGTLNKHGKYLSGTTVCVRGRVREDLEDLAAYAKQEITCSHTSDYPYRLLVDVTVLAQYRYDQTFDILGYDNFKSHVTRTRGHERSGVLHSAWSVFQRLERLDPGVRAEQERQRKAHERWRRLHPSAPTTTPVTYGSTASGYPWARSQSVTTKSAEESAMTLMDEHAGFLSEQEQRDVDAQLLRDYGTDIYANADGAGAWWRDDAAAGAAARAEIEKAASGHGRKARRARRLLEKGRHQR